MKPIELVQAAKAADAKAFGQLDERRATKIVSLALAEIRRQLASMKEGRLLIPGLGNFVVRNVTTQKDGEPVTVRRVILHEGPGAAAKKVASKP